MPYDILYFDADNTLFDFDKAEKLAFKRTMEEHSVPFSTELYEDYSRINAGLWAMLEKKQIDKPTLSLKRFSDAFSLHGITADVVAINKSYGENLGLESVLYDGVKEILQTLYLNGKEMYVLTNGIEKVQTKRFSLSGTEKFFKKIFISDVIGHQKPSKEFFDYVIRHTENFRPEKTVMIGDSLHSDMLGAVNQNLSTVWFNPKKKPNDLNLKITYEIQDLSELLPILI